WIWSVEGTVSPAAGAASWRRGGGAVGTPPSAGPPNRKTPTASRIIAAPTAPSRPSGIAPRRSPSGPVGVVDCMTDGSTSLRPGATTLDPVEQELWREPRQQRRQRREGPGQHHDPDHQQESAADPADPREPGTDLPHAAEELLEEERRDQEGHCQPEGIHEEQADAVTDRPSGRGDRQDPTEHRPQAGCPPGAERHPHHHGAQVAERFVRKVDPPL